MIPLAELKQDLDLNKSLGSIIETMKTGSAIMLREFQSKAKAPDTLFKMLKDCFKTIAEKGSVKHPLFFGDDNLPSCIVMITSDDGFVGELNTFIINAALEEKKKESDEIVVLGERGANFFEDRNEAFTSFPGISENIKPMEIAGLKKHMIKGFFEKRFGRVVVVYPESSNVGSWKVNTAELLPFNTSVISDGAAARVIDEELIIEPSMESVAEGLVHLWLNVALYNIFWACKFSEFGARLMQLEGSEQELMRMKQQLSLQYFKHVHAAADTTIREILSARLGIKS
ncbi:MAG: FoF1 ATP synthase subunit gamma [Candidatus Omnitrophota bacterium]|nr:FoF1 ATP synthase subunit gamma [Candidatus Omnitrophota bacterium]